MARKKPLLSIIQAAGWPIWPLILCSILALAFTVERFISLKNSRVLGSGLVDEAIGISRTAVPAPETVNQLAQHSGDAVAAIGDDVTGEDERRRHYAAQPVFAAGAALVFIFAAAGAVGDGDNGGPDAHFFTRALRVAISFRRSAFRWMNPAASR